MKPNEAPIDYSKPVAYDTNGRPLYAHPPQNGSEAPQVVHMSRPLDPAPVVVSPEIQHKHELSVRKYPRLNLSEGEYVISAVRRHPFGLIPIFAVVGSGMVGIALLLGMYTNYVDNAVDPSRLPSVNAISLIATLFGVLLAIGGFIAVYIYTNNKFFLTNESVVQEIQDSLFHKHEQTVSLINIEDASYSQAGIIASLFNFGDIRLSTEGDETTYRFSYVANPKKHIATLNNAVEAFKNGRPVSDSDT
jgi:hypothetical protein